ncbi:MAG TPA: hypothetical protein VK866_13830 [Acidimicrobiales bacterium]|nr:hypothetical protein [Acidimicrobiales bacterium]
MPGARPVVDLGGTWRAVAADDTTRRALLDGDVADDHWAEIEVPGHWQLVPELADVDGPVLHQRRFGAPRGDPDHRRWLVLDGVCYQGDVWLDGRYLGDTEGYFFAHQLEVTEQLAARDDHVLAVEVACAPPGDRRAKRQLTGSLQHARGLDADLNPGGIWAPVRIEESGPVRIRHARVRCVAASESEATVAVRLVVDTDITRAIDVRTRISPAGGSDSGGVEHEAGHPLAAGENRLEWTVTVPSPRRWWPHALGDQPMYEVEVEVRLADRDADAAPSDRRVLPVGLREIELRRWILHVNGERLFAKGTNLGPTRPHLATATPDEVRADVAAAREANLDLVRVHTHVARPELYDAADDLGVLVWQDLPLQWGYARGTRSQATRQAREAVDLLAHHPSVAVWCGHGEPFRVEGPGTGADPGVERRRRLVGHLLPTWNRSVLDRSVRRALRHADDSRPVVAHSGVLPHLPQLDGTDSHLWFGWEHGSIDDLATAIARWPRIGRFVSELGAQAVPTTDDAFAPERWPDLDWDRLERHHGLERERLTARVDPADHDTFASWRDATQAYQAELLGRQIEALRRLKYRPTGGFAQFLLADGAPTIGYSVLDHERRPKAGWDALVAACRPVIVTADPLPRPATAGRTAAIDVHVVSDLRHPLPGVEVRSTLTWPGGRDERRFGGDVGADACLRVTTLAVEVPDGPGRLELELVLTDADGTELARRVDAVALEG